MTNKYSSKSLHFIVLILLCSSVWGQGLKKEKMEQLNYLIGEWVGTSKIFENEVVTKQGSAFEKISYDLDKNILVIKLNTEFLQLHTIVYYNEEDQSYYYHRFSKDGAARYPAEFKDGQLIVWKDKTTRFFFGSTADGGFKEYGEKFIDGEWIKTFEDIFKNTQ